VVVMTCCLSDRRVADRPICAEFARCGCICQNERHVPALILSSACSSTATIRSAAAVSVRIRGRDGAGVSRLGPGFEQSRDTAPGCGPRCGSCLPEPAARSCRAQRARSCRASTFLLMPPESESTRRHDASAPANPS
jgi:hypothetical protein